MKHIREADVLVVGSGPAGLAAASAAAERGKRVLLLDQGIHPGGQIWRHRDERTLPSLAQRLLARARQAGVEFVQEARVIDAPAPGELLIEVRGMLQSCRAAGIIVCTGARERFLPFPGWTLPGVTGVGGLQALLKGGLQLKDARVILAGSGPLLLPVAAAVAQSGARLMLVAEQAGLSSLIGFASHALRDTTRLGQAVRYRAAFASTPFRSGTWVTRAFGTERLSEVELTNGRRTWVAPCEWLGSSVGLVPNTELAQILGCTVRDEMVTVDSLQATSVANTWAAGECTGVKGEMAAIAEGEIAGAGAAGDPRAAEDSSLQRRRVAGRRFGDRLAAAFAVRAELRALADDETIICRCEDVRRGAIDPSWTQRQAKLWTRVGMGACQGAVCGPACSVLFGWEQNQVRPPLGAPRLDTWCPPEEGD